MNYEFYMMYFFIKNQQIAFFDVLIRVCTQSDEKEVILRKITFNQ